MLRHKGEARLVCTAVARHSYRLGYLTAMVIDTIGNGLWIPFALLFFTHGRGMRLADAGAALTMGSLVSLLVGGFLTGAVVDRIGPFRAATLSSLIRVIAFPCYLADNTVASLAIIAVAVSFAGRLFWVAHPGMVRALAPSEEARVGLFSLISAFRSIGLGIGGLIASLGVWAERGNGLFWSSIVVANAISFALCGLLFWRLRRFDHKTEHCAGSGVGRYRDVLAQRRFLVFVAAIFVLALANVGFDSILPVYLLALGFPAWAPPIAYLLASILIAAFAPLATKWGRRRSGLRLLALAAALLGIAFAALIAMVAVDDVGRTALLGVAVTFFGLAAATWGATALNTMLNFVPRGRAGRHSAVYSLSWGVAIAVGPGLFSSLFTLGRVLPWIFLGVVLVFAVTAFLASSRAARHTLGASGQ
ncbi:MFS transporter [Mycobacterium riyadhense]|uniref:Major Facilitator Superfamily protein n=1 Tax=Mycobacterium riyadhense TaxID=486698 RepID=A0A653EX38_9MYCO|nr:MFS transporter [Mycobacterium riyadhense]VTP01899.1 Major Facilitator Superfamily protein [Mycobacterium riyadhense]